jgi:hypothetical protein
VNGEPALQEFADATIRELPNRCRGEAHPSLGSAQQPGASLIWEITQRDMGWCAMSVETKQAADSSIGELMSQLSSQVSRLIRDELRLAEKEFQQSAKHAGIGPGYSASRACWRSLARWLSSPLRWPPCRRCCRVWAALIVGGVLLIAAGLAAVGGRSPAREATPAARRTVETVKADIQEIKDPRHGTT